MTVCMYENIVPYNRETVRKLPFFNPMEPSRDTLVLHCVERFRGQNVSISQHLLTAVLAPVKGGKAPLLNYGKEEQKKKSQTCVLNLQPETLGADLRGDGGYKTTPTLLFPPQ